ncbi:hypothetical protein ACFL34_05080 [Candidatus Sumerlaeota bacterium]
MLLPGVYKTHAYWGERFQRSEMEGKFYLANPDKLIYSEEAAHWFLPGLTELYSVTQSHFVCDKFMVSEQSREMLNSFSTIWRYREGEFVEDENLFLAIKSQNENQGPRLGEESSY